MPETPAGLYVVWRGYQRRAEVLGPALGCTVAFLPNHWNSRWLRPLDYLLHFFATVRLIDRLKPEFMVFQSPPPFAAYAAIVKGVPFLIDAHNAAVQGRWSRLPTVHALSRLALAVVAHNKEAAEVARRVLPGSKILTLRDPISEIRRPGTRTARIEDQVLFICSFGSDEPLGIIYHLIESRPDLAFVITAPSHRLPPTWRGRFEGLPNLRLTGFLPTEQYQELLLTSGVAVVLTTRSATQPSGACEALASDTPLVVSRTTLTEHLFGAWAQTAANSVEELSRALDVARANVRSLSDERAAWHSAVSDELLAVKAILPGNLWAKETDVKPSQT